MPEPIAPTAADVRTAADALKAAIDAHLAAVEVRSDETDSRVRTAFLEMASAAEAYDDVLYDAYNEVTPFEIPGQFEDVGADPVNPEAVSVLIRRDYQVTDPGRILSAARLLAAEASGAIDAEIDLDTVGGSLAALFDVFDPDEIHNRSDELGLTPGDSTTWVLAADPEAAEELWFDDPFSEIDPEQLVCRFDIVGDDEDEEYFDTFAEDDSEDELDGIEVA